MGRLTFVGDLFLSSLCTGIPVIDPGFDLRQKLVLLIPSISFGLCFVNILLSTIYSLLQYSIAA